MDSEPGKKIYHIAKTFGYKLDYILSMKYWEKEFLYKSIINEYSSDNVSVGASELTDDEFMDAIR